MPRPARARHLGYAARRQNNWSPSRSDRSERELYNRFTSPFYAFAAGLIGFAALGEARTTRQGRGWSIGFAVVLFAVVRLVGLAVNMLLRGKPGVPLPIWIPISAWALPVGSALIGLDLIFGGPVYRASAKARVAFAECRSRR